MGDRVNLVAPAMVAVVMVAAAALIQLAAAGTYKVGDSSGWTVPANTSFYSTWGSQHSFQIEDILEFDFATGVHTVAKVSKEAYNTCNISSPIALFQTGPVNITLNSSGSIFFICTIGNHCNDGQKLAIDVGTSEAPASSPKIPAAASPPPPPPIDGSGESSQTPPPAGAATSLAITAIPAIFVLISVLGLLY